MGFQSGLKVGGGGLFVGDGVITDYQFTKIGVNEKSPGKYAYLVIEFRKDGSEKPFTKHLIMGQASEYTISKDGQSLGTGEAIGAKAGLFISTLLKADFPENRLPDTDAGEPVNLVGVIGTRVRLGEQRDDYTTEKKGQREYVNKQGKTVKTDWMDSIVEKVLALSTISATVTSSKPNGKIVETNIADLAQETLVTILQKNVNAMGKPMPLDRERLRMKVFGEFGAKHPQRAARDAVVAFLQDDENICTLAANEVIIANDVTVELT